MTKSTTQDQVREAVRQRYAAAATRVTQEHAAAESALPVLDAAGCCGTTTDSACGCGSDPGNSSNSVITSDLYTIDELADLPSAAVLASLGCGNPTALAELKAGETVLDLGSGGGIDVLISAKRVGPTGFAYGLDMTDEMLVLAEKNRQERGVENVRFLKGQIEQIPLPDNTVDVIISNCVINLSADKPRVLREASVCSSRAVASLSLMSLCKVTCRRSSGGAWSSGSAALLEPSKRKHIGHSWQMQAFQRLVSN